MACRAAGVLLLLLPLLPGWSPVSADRAPSKAGADAAGTWWSLKPVTKPVPPAARDFRSLKTSEVLNWARNPIDQFILAKLLEKGLEPAPPADRRTLIRRVKFNLVGLPPTPEEIDAFVKDPAPDAYEKLVDRLL